MTRFMTSLHILSMFLVALAMCLAATTTARADTIQFGRGSNLTPWDERFQADGTGVSSSVLAIDGVGGAGPTSSIEDYSYVAFDGIIGPVAPQIPDGSTIHSAMLVLRTASTSLTTNPQSVDATSVHQLLLDISARPLGPDAINGGGVAGTFYGTVPLDSLVPITADTDFTFDVTAAVAAWSADINTNHGFLLLPEGGDEASYDRVSTELAHSPLLIVDYTPAPEPSTLALAAFGVAALVALGWRRKSYARQQPDPQATLSRRLFSRAISNDVTRPGVPQLRRILLTRKAYTFAFSFLSILLVGTVLYADMITMMPLANESFESGQTDWDSPLPFGSFGSINGATSLSATEGNNFWGHSRNFTTSSSNISITVATIGQTVDVSTFDSISSVTFGSDVFGTATIVSGSGTVKYQTPATGGVFLRYRDAGLNLLDQTIFEFPDGADINAIGGFHLDNVRTTDNSVPVGTKFIEYFSAGSFLVGDQGAGDITVNLQLGFDDMYLSVTGEPVPEPSTVVLSAMGLVGLLTIGLRRRRR